MGTNQAGVQRRCWVLRGAQGASAVQRDSRFTWLWPGSQAWAAGTVGREMLQEQKQENRSLLSNTFTAGQKSGQVEKTSDTREAGSLIAKRSSRCCAWLRDDYGLIQLLPGTKQIFDERLKALKSGCGGWSRLHPAVRPLPRGQQPVPLSRDPSWRHKTCLPGNARSVPRGPSCPLQMKWAAEIRKGHRFKSAWVLPWWYGG